MRPPSRPEQPRSPFSSASDGLGIAAGIAVAFLLSPQLYDLGASWVGAYTAIEYGAQFEEAARFVFLLFLAFLLFNLTRMMCAATFSGFGLWLGTTILSRFR
jgi:hypothetical protein